MRKLGQKGYLGVLYPKEVGGTSQGIIYDTIVSEEIAYVCPAADAMRGVSTVFSGAPLHRFGTNEQKQKYLRPIIIHKNQIPTLLIVGKHDKPFLPYLEFARQNIP